MCKACGRYFQGRSSKYTDSLLRKEYLEGKQTVSQLSARYDISPSTVRRHLRVTVPRLVIPVISRSVVLTDATYFGRSFGIVLMKDAQSKKILWHKFIGRHERLTDYEEGLHSLEARGIEVQGVVSDGLKGLRKVFSQYPFQLCQFHQIARVRQLLTSNPRLLAAVELWQLVCTLSRKSRSEFMADLEAWYGRWKDFLAERSTGEDGRTHYTHRRLRSAHLSLKRNTDVLWTFEDYPDAGIPNTNNSLEATNSEIKKLLRVHSGISRKRRKELIWQYINTQNTIKQMETR